MKNNINKTENIVYKIKANNKTYPGFSVSTLPYELSSKLNFLVESSSEFANLSWLSWKTTLSRFSNETFLSLNNDLKIRKLKPHIMVNNKTYPDFSVSELPFELSSKLNFLVESSSESANLSWTTKLSRLLLEYFLDLKE